MEAAEPAPQYAPDDPTLPKPWMGLIDGSTGLLYYWNPETNVTQYEKPASLPPPLPLGQPPVSAPKLAQIPIPHSTQPNSLVPHATQPTQHHGQPMTQQQDALQLGQPPQQQGQHLRPHVMPHPNQPMFSHPGQQMPQHGGIQLSQWSGQPMQHQANQQVVQHQSSHVPQPHGQQYTYQQSILPQAQQISQQQSQLSSQGLQFSNQQEFKAASIKGEEADFLQRNQTGFSPSQIQQAGVPSSQNLSGGNNLVYRPQTGFNIGQTQQFSSSVNNVQHSASMIPLQQTGADLVHQQHGTSFQNNVGMSMMHNQQSNMPPAGLKMAYENNIHGGAGNDYYYNSKTEGAVAGSGQPNFATTSTVRNRQDSRIYGVPFQSITSSYAGGFSSADHSMHNMYGHAIDGLPISKNALRGPLIGNSDATNLTPAEIYCQKHEVMATGGNVPPPFMTFEATGFPPEILRDVRYLLQRRSICRTLLCTCNNCTDFWRLHNGQLEPFLCTSTRIHSAGFLSPTPIQAQTWPIALQCRDIVAIAKTGSGKTLGYLIPAFIIIKQYHNNPQNGPTVLVLAPTRELATQIQDEVVKFGQSSRVSCTCLYGGAPKGPQLKELDRGADIVVATPGRLNDILEMKKINFGQISLLVLDEADRMLDMGFEPQIRKIVNEIPPRRQTLMYTATWPKEVRKIASDLLVNPVQVNIGSVELAANKSITQYVEVVPQMEKERRLDQILRAQERGSKVIIFCSTKRLCDHLARSIGRNFPAAAIHGDKSQGERDWVLNQFRNGKSPILVATDVAARGLDIKDIRVVINYDFPTGIEDYVHRIGRTGRAGATGVSYTFFSEQDWKYAADLVKVLEGANQQVPPEVREMALRGGPALGKDRSGMHRFDSGNGNAGGRGYLGGHAGMRDGSFSSTGGMRNIGFGGRGGLRDGNFSGRGGMRDGGFGGRGAFGSRGGRNDLFSGPGNRGRGYGGSGGRVGRGRNERVSYDRYNNMDGRGRGRGRGRFDRRDFMDRSRGRSYSRSPERVRTWGYSRSPSRSWSRSRSRSRSKSWSRSRSRSSSRSPRRSRSPGQSCSPRRSRSHSRSPGHSRSPVHGRSPWRSRSPGHSHSPVHGRSPRRSRSPGHSPSPVRGLSPRHSHSPVRSDSPQQSQSHDRHEKIFDEKDAPVPEFKGIKSRTAQMSPGAMHGSAFSGGEQLQEFKSSSSEPLHPGVSADPSYHSVADA